MHYILANACKNGKQLHFCIKQLVHNVGFGGFRRSLQIFEMWGYLLLAPDFWPQVLIANYHIAYNCGGKCMLSVIVPTD